MDVRFWGVRGSIAVSGARYVSVGGNTPCVEVLHDGARLILDGGTGLRALGESIGWRPVEATLLFSHVHWDHIQGVPFFTPAFHPDAKLTFMGATRSQVTLRDSLAAQMRPPTFPITLDAFGSKVGFVEIDRNRAFDVGPFHVVPVDLDHPDGVLAYRIEAGGKALVYATDVEHFGAVDRRLAALSEGADLLVHDAMFTEPEYHGRAGIPRKGWGHSTWNEAVDVARLAGVDRVALFHHDPQRGDDAVDAIEAEARDAFAGAFAAREGGCLAL